MVKLTKKYRLEELLALEANRNEKKIALRNHLGLSKNRLNELCRSVRGDKINMKTDHLLLISQFFGVPIDQIIHKMEGMEKVKTVSELMAYKKITFPVLEMNPENPFPILNSIHALLYFNKYVKMWSAGEKYLVLTQNRQAFGIFKIENNFDSIIRQFPKHKFIMIHDKAVIDPNGKSKCIDIIDFGGSIAQA